MRRLILAAFIPVCLAQAPPKAVVPEPAADFGTVKQGDRVVRKFEVRNAGGSALTLDLATLSETGMTARFTEKVEPGGQAAVTLAWETKSYAGRAEGHAVFRTNDPLMPALKLRMGGLIMPPVEIAPIPAVFFSVYKGESAERRLKVINHEAKPLEVKPVQRPSEHYAVSVNAIRPGSEYELVFTVGAAAPAGRFTETLELATDSPTVPVLKVSVNVFVKPDVYANPDALDFGRLVRQDVLRSPGMLDLRAQTFMVRRRAGEFELKSVSCDLPFLSVRKTPEGKSPIFRLDVGLLPDRMPVGKAEGRIRLETTDPAFPEIFVPVRAAIE